MEERSIELVQRLVDRLERLSADSAYAHRASGLRGSLLGVLEQLQAGKQLEGSSLEQLLEQGYAILARAAEEIGGTDE